MKKQHELMIFVGQGDQFHVVTTSLRFDIFDWMSFKAIRGLLELNAFGRVGKSSLMLVPTADICMASSKGDLLLKHGDVEIVPVYMRDPTRGSGLQPNLCFTDRRAYLENFGLSEASKKFDVSEVRILKETAGA